MKRFFALLVSAALTAGLLATPCFAAEPVDQPAPPSVTTPQPPGNPEEAGIQPCDAMDTWGEMS